MCEDLKKGEIYMLNRVVLIGHLTKDPELRTASNDISVTSFTIAVDRNFNNQQGEKETDFIPVVAWRKLADTCAKYLAKGRLVAVSGRMQVRSYEGKEGKRYITEVVADEVQFLEKAESKEKFVEVEDNVELPF
jgi:single-strand DNA-binding protein